MPNIKTLDAPQLAIQPSDIAASTAREAGTAENIYARETGQAIGTGIARLGGQIGQAVDQANTMQWISHGAATYASLHSDLTQKWNDTASKTDPNDTSIAQGFREQTLGPALDNFQQAFDGAPPRVQEWALQRSEQLRQDFERKVAADMSTRAGLAMHQNITNMERSYSNTAELDPTALPHIAESVKTDVDALIKSNPFITADQAARVKSELVPNTLKTIAQSAFIGMARANPDGAKLALDKGQFDDYFDAKDKLRASKIADEIKHAKLADDTRAYELEKRQKTDAANASHDQYIQRIYAGDSRNALRDAFSDPKLAGFGHLKENLESFSHALSIQMRDKSENTPHPVEFRRLITDLRETERNEPYNLSDKPIYESFNKGQISKSEFTTALSIYHSINSPTERMIGTQMRRLETIVGNSIEGAALRMADAQQWSDLLNKFEADGREKLRQAEAKGESRTPLADPMSPQFVFSDARFRAMMPSAKQVISEQADKVRQAEPEFTKGSPPPPRTLGEQLNPAYFRWQEAQSEKKFATEPNPNPRTINGKLNQAYFDWEKEHGMQRPTLKMPVKEFATEEEAKKAGLKPGTRIKINGVSGTWQ